MYQLICERHTHIDTRMLFASVFVLCSYEVYLSFHFCFLSRLQTSEVLRGKTERFIHIKQWWWVRARKDDESELLLDFDYLLVMHIQTEIRMWLLYFRTCWCSWTLFSIPFQLFMSNSLIAFRFLCVCFCLCFCFEIGCLHRINMWLTCPNIVPYI